MARLVEENSEISVSAGILRSLSDCIRSESELRLIIEVAPRGRESEQRDDAATNEEGVTGGDSVESEHEKCNRSCEREIHPMFCDCLGRNRNEAGSRGQNDKKPCPGKSERRPAVDSIDRECKKSDEHDRRCEHGSGIGYDRKTIVENKRMRPEG